jgi:radical SAM protein with 4Fe4S-binding SPASM domain
LSNEIFLRKVLLPFILSPQLEERGDYFHRSALTLVGRGDIDVMNDYREVLHKVDQHLQRIKRLPPRPRLQVLLWEATKNCNLSCFHCCNQKMDWHKESELTTVQAKRIFYEIAEDFNPKEIRIGITGGEPTLRKDLSEMVKFLSGLFFKNVHITSNGLKVAKDFSLLDKLVKSGMTGLSISIDGLQEGYKRTRGIDRFHEIINLLRYGVDQYSDQFNLYTLSVVNNYNKNEIPQLIELLASIGIKHGRVSLTSKVGRAETADEKLYKLSPQDLYNLLQWIAQKRKDYREGNFPMEIELGEDGWCGLKYELLTKRIEGLFFCTTGITTANILYDGKISACPYIVPNLSIQGDALKERFSDIWNNRFKLFRKKNWLRQGKCEGCDQWLFCRGGPMHYRDENGAMNKCLYDEIKEVNDYEKTLEPLNPNITEKGGITMARIKIKDLPKDQKITKEEMKKVFGGLLLKSTPPTLPSLPPQLKTEYDSELLEMLNKCLPPYNVL